ncbi:tubulin epsilon [Angomonas deanei]|uniref:Tubulin/FtsZ family, GTPase domain/Tubulin C-terminal domain containing protein, putative n=1 Tax=Angomonas deanei TaxID=59799 RepID=A0A7G2CNR3_9TRYP|nr:tubulin epsilon [Angomonas deanei]CAD2220999.1 Tubulin/FtsZ family, GTPase domain/Tubulin C-terminal domain containing protein, putative [Angomonas deanei]|eukprot:EPY27698.1 tubulin epsilon [Angomonas deanei]
MHSLSGGTGSGLGSRVVGMLEEEFPHVFRISPVVMPSVVDDVVTAPYNSCFSLKELIEHSDCVIPIDNDALARMVERAMKGEKSTTTANAPSSANSAAYNKDKFNAAVPTATKGLPYEHMNALVAQMLSNLTSPMRFPGPLNFDINEVTTNLVPYPRLHMLTTALAPLSVSARHQPTGTRGIDQIILSCLDKDHQLVDYNSPTHDHVCLATAILARGPQITIGDMTRNIAKLKEKIRLPYWNEDGFKTALCGVSPIGHKDSVLMISNNCGIASKVESLYNKFMKLYSVKSHVHHYESFLSTAYFDMTAEEIHTMLDDYTFLDSSSAMAPKDAPKRMKDLIYY